MKTCKKCNGTKPLAEFYKDKRMADGHLNQCKACVKVYSKAYAAEHRERRREHKKSHRAKNREQYREYSRCAYEKNGGAVSAKAHTKWKAKNPLKKKAINAVSHAIRTGKMARPDLCECCGASARVQGHHPDYSKQLDVHWLCPPCHSQWHIKYGEGLNGKNQPQPQR